MNPRWHKVLRDLKENKARSILVVLAIAVGISGFASVLTAYAILTRELNSGYLATNPASATLWTDRIEDQAIASLQDFPGIADLEERRTISARVRVGANEWRNALLFVIKDFSDIRVSTLKPQQGKWPPDAGEILIERDALGVAHARIGDVLTLKTANGAEQSLKITGSVHDVGQAQARMEQMIYGYITQETSTQLGEERYFDQLKIIVSGDRFNEEHVRNIVEKLQNRIEALGYRVRRVEVPDPGQHPHADLMGSSLLFQSSFGFLALLLSGVLVILLLSAMMAGQIRQIGIMKALGAKRSQVMGIYFGAVIVLSAVALAVAMPVSKVAGAALANFMARFLNFDMQSYATPLWVFGLETAVAFVVPLLAAAYPVWRGSRISVREALIDYGIALPATIDKAPARRMPLARPILLSLRNMFRKRARLALTLLALSAGGTIFISAWNVRASFIHTIDLMFESMRFDLAITFADLYAKDTVEAAVRSTPGIIYVESWVGTEAVVVKSDGSHANPISITAPPTDTKLLELKIIEGRSLLPGDSNALVINNRLARLEPAMQVGKSIRLRISGKEQTWKVVGMARQAFTGPVAYADHASLAVASGQVDRTRRLSVVTAKHDKPFVDETKRALEQKLKAAGFEVVSNRSMADFRRSIDEHNSVLYAFLVVMALLIVVVGGLGLMTVMSINVLERRREIGVMRAIGATSKAVMMIVLAEGALIGLLSWVIAVAGSFLVSNQIGNMVANRMFGSTLDFALDPGGIASWLLMALLFGAIASFLPARHAARLPIRRLIEYE